MNAKTLFLICTVNENLNASSTVYFKKKLPQPENECHA